VQSINFTNLLSPFENHEYFFAQRVEVLPALWIWLSVRTVNSVNLSKVGVNDDMAIQYAPRNGTILLCDFTGIEPEMVKRRPVVMVSSVSCGDDVLGKMRHDNPCFLFATQFAVQGQRQRRKTEISAHGNFRGGFGGGESGSVEGAFCRRLTADRPVCNN
jgi:hypothetical protein